MIKPAFGREGAHVLTAIPYDKTCGMPFSIEAIDFIKEVDVKKIKKEVNKRIIQCFSSCGMKKRHWEDELGNYDFYLIPSNIFHKINDVISSANISCRESAHDISSILSSLYDSFDVRKLVEV